MSLEWSWVKSGKDIFFVFFDIFWLIQWIKLQIHFFASFELFWLFESIDYANSKMKLEKLWANLNSTLTHESNIYNIVLLPCDPYNWVTFCESEYYQDTCAYILDLACLMRVFWWTVFLLSLHFRVQAIAINQNLYIPKSNGQDRSVLWLLWVFFTYDHPHTYTKCLRTFQFQDLYDVTLFSHWPQREFDQPTFYQNETT